MQQQCQNCDSSDQVTIAGKSFCANCGSEAQANTTNPNPTTAIADPVVIPADNKPTTPLASPSTDPIAPISSTTTEPVKPTTPATPGPLSKFAAPPQVASPVSEPVSIPSDTAKLAETTRPPLPINSSVSSDGIQPAKLNKPPIASVIDQYAGQPSPSPTFEMMSPKGSGGNEISSLDSHDEGVFTDAQLDELSKSLPSNNQSSAPTPRPMQDIVAAPAAPAPMPTPNPDITPIPPVPAPALGQPQTPVSQPSAMDISSHPEAPQPQAGARIMPSTTGYSDVNPSAAQAATLAASQTSTLLAQVKPDVKPKKGLAPKIASVAVSAVGVILLGIYVWQINYPNLALKVAGSKAGISASLPSYLPNGWRIAGDIQSNPGNVSYNLQSSSNKVAITQTKTDWDSQALAENYLQNKTNNYTAVQAQGLTIYLYNNQASWVNHGTWYRIEGDNNGLSQDQLIKMATSL